MSQTGADTIAVEWERKKGTRWPGSFCRPVYHRKSMWMSILRYTMSGVSDSSPSA